MKGRRIYLDHIDGREAAAMVVNGELDDLLIDAPGLPRAGAIARALCDRGLKGQGGMIVRLPNGASGWLRHATGLRESEAVLVQVTGHAEPGKAVPLTDRLLFKSRHAIVTPGAPGVNVSRQIRDEAVRGRLAALGAAGMEGSAHGLILRSAAERADDGEVAEDIAQMRHEAEQVLSEAGDGPAWLAEGDGPHILAWREWPHGEVETKPGCFARDGVLDLIDAARAADVPLGLAFMSVEPTRALVAVDVNTGGDTSPAATLKANLAAARALPRALRVRGLGGQVVVDFAPMPKGQRAQVEQSLRDAFRADPVETSLTGWTAMGLYELSRKRERLPLARVLP